MTPTGSAPYWGPLFSARGRVWAQTWEGSGGWGAPAYDHVLDRAGIGARTSVLDCGCGAGRFGRLAADRGAHVAGVDAAEVLVKIAGERTPDGDFRVGDLEALPWPDASFDVVTGFTSFQFAANKSKALTEARRVSRGIVAVVIPARASESGIAAVFAPLRPLFSAESQAILKERGIWSLSEPGKLDDMLAGAGLAVTVDDEIACPVVFEDIDEAALAFLGAGPTALAIQHAGEVAVAEALRDALRPFGGPAGRVTVPAWFRVVLTAC